MTLVGDEGWSCGVESNGGVSMGSLLPAHLPTEIGAHPATKQTADSTELKDVHCMLTCDLLTLT